MGSIVGMAFAVIGSITIAIYSYFKHRSTSAMIDRAAGSGKAPCKWLVKWDHEAAIEWATGLLAHPDNVAIIDITESGPNPRDEIIEIAVLDGTGSVLFTSLFKPVTHRLNPKSTLIHGLQDEDLITAPGFAEVAPSFFLALGDRTRIYYQQDFVERIIGQTCQRYEINMPDGESVDLRHYLAAYQGEWSPYDGRYRLPSLPGSDYRALTDCKIMLDQIRKVLPTVSAGEICLIFIFPTSEYCPSDDNWSIF